MIRLTDKELDAVNRNSRQVYHECDLKKEVAKAQLVKIAKWIKERPTDGWDKWHFYNKDLAEALLKECE